MATVKKPVALEVHNLGVKIGADAAAVTASHAAILAILNAKVDNKTMRDALKALGSICSVNGATISNTSINVGGGNATN